MGWKNLIIASISLTLVMLSAVANSIEFARNVAPQTSRLISSDFELLSRLQWGRDDQEMLRIFKVNEINARTMQAWFDERVHYILDQNHVLDQTSVLPLNPMSQSSRVDDSYRINHQVSSDTVSAINLGTSLYSSSLKARMKLVFDISGIGMIPIKSPRVGILQVLEPLTKPLGEGEFSDVTEFTNRVYRLSTLFHEGRHSDGHGEHLGFPHVICPVGHTYEGIAACDASSNGAYRISALFIGSVLKGCETCSIGQKEALKFVYADYLDRILTTTSGQEHLVKQPLEWDDSPEGW
jgi:hypothetical protein